MLHTVLNPALVIFRFVAFTADQERAADRVEHICQVISGTTDQLKLHVVNGEYNVLIKGDGTIDCPLNTNIHGKKAYVQWQGNEPKDRVLVDFDVELKDYAEEEIRAERTGPLHGAALASHEDLRRFALGNAARRLEALGDGRLMRFLAAEYPQVALASKA